MKAQVVLNGSPVPVELDRVTGGVRVTLSDGEEYEITEAEGHLQVWARGGGTLLAHSVSGNVMQIVNWPTFQPLRPPTAEQPVLASREHIIEVTGSTGGLGGAALEAVQAALDANPEVKRIIEETINATVKKSEYQSGSVEIR